jgi:hypothetical protein
MIGEFTGGFREFFAQNYICDESMIKDLIAR